MVNHGGSWFTKINRAGSSWVDDRKSMEIMYKSSEFRSETHLYAFLSLVYWRFIGTRELGIGINQAQMNRLGA